MKAYLDNSATTRPTQGVIRAMTVCMEEGWHNPSSVYGPAVAAFRQVRACREAILEKLGAPGERLIFTSGGTEANNLAILGAVERMRGTGYSRLPVYHEDIDRIVGIVHFKDLVAPLMDGKEHEPVAEYAYEAMFVPETKDLFPLLAEMQTNRQQMAIVVDEYGGTDGLITVEDIVEEVVGEIVDETDRENPFIEQESENVWVVDGRFPVEDAAELGWPVEDSADYETIAGWLMSMLDSVPQVGEELAFDGYRFKIQAMRRRRISTVRVERLDDPSPSCVDAVEAIDREEA